MQQNLIMYDAPIQAYQKSAPEPKQSSHPCLYGATMYDTCSTSQACPINAGGTKGVEDDGQQINKRQKPDAEEEGDTTFYDAMEGRDG